MREAQKSTAKLQGKDPVSSKGLNPQKLSAYEETVGYAQIDEHVTAAYAVIAGRLTGNNPSTWKSARFENYQALIARASDAFGDNALASKWLSTPSVDLGGEVSLKIAEEDSYSLERLEPVFARLEHGIDF